MIKQWIATVGPIVVAAYLWVIPQIQAQAADYLKGQLDVLGVSSENIAKLNQNIEELTKQSEEREKDVEELKGDLGKVIILLEQQQRLNQIMALPPVQQAAPPPIPLPQ